MEGSWGVISGVTCLALTSLGAVLGMGVAAASAVGAWKKCFLQNKQAPFILLALVGFPITQVLYSMVLMFSMFKVTTVTWPLLILGIFAGIIIGLSAYLQGWVGASASDAQAETGQGFTNYIASLGVIETVPIFMFMLTLLAIRQFGA
jgi:V/A-type H+-transporting ATPase subunit K